MQSLLIANSGGRRGQPILLEKMFRLRHQVFKERLNWDVDSIDGQERDRFDDFDPIYMVVRSTDGEVQGSWRLLPTIGPNMLKDVFPVLLHGQSMPEDPLIWEVSRFSVHLPDSVGASRSASLGLVHDVTRRLLLELVRLGLSMGLTRVVSVSDLRFERILTRAGLPCTRFGPPVTIGRTQAVAGWIEVSETNLALLSRTADPSH